MYLYREKAPGQRECDDAIEVLNGCIREVDQASLAAISQQLTPREDISMEVNTQAPMNTDTHAEIYAYTQVSEYVKNELPCFYVLFLMQASLPTTTTIKVVIISGDLYCIVL